MTHSPIPDADSPAALASFGLRPEAAGTRASGIANVFRYGHGRQGLLPLWVGEGDLATDDLIVAAATKSLADGETFYSPQKGHPDTREAVARYLARVYADSAAASWAFAPERISMTCGGMHALQIAMRLVAGAGDDIVVLTPAWPNFSGAAAVSGARAIEVPLAFDTSGASPLWRLDMGALAASLTPATKAIVINSPANPTGWTASHADLGAILELARSNGLWIIADEIYGRFVYQGARAPSFHDIIEPSDRVLFVQTLSKNWAMTGWRIGWIEAPADIGPTIENLIQFSTSGVPLFSQRAAIAALDHGEPFFQKQLARAAESRAAITSGLSGLPRIRFAMPQAAFYLFFAIEGMEDTASAALQLVDEAGLGLAPGSAFGAAGEGFFRICLARAPGDMAEAARRFQKWLSR